MKLKKGTAEQRKFVAELARAFHKAIHRCKYTPNGNVVYLCARNQYKAAKRVLELGK